MSQITRKKAVRRRSFLEYEFPGDDKAAEKKPKAGLDSLDPQLVDDALLAGRRVNQAERECRAAVSKASIAIERLLKTCATLSGGLRGQEEATTNGTRIIPIGTSKSKDATHIVVSTGEVKNCYTDPGALRAVWLALPDILSRHLKACAAISEKANNLRLAATSIARNVEAIEALLESDVPISRKREVINQVFGDTAVQDALDAAEATGDAGAATKLLRDQAGYARPETQTGDAVAFVVNFFDTTLVDALEAQDPASLPATSVEVKTTGKHGEYAWVIWPQQQKVAPGTGPRADCRVILDLELLYHILRSGDVNLFMQAYFDGRVVIKGDPMAYPAVGKLIGDAMRSVGGADEA